MKKCLVDVVDVVDVVDIGDLLQKLLSEPSTFSYAGRYTAATIH